MTTQITLTKRQRQVLEHMSNGLNDKQMAEVLFLSQHTVCGYTKAVLKVLNVETRTHAVAQALRMGLIK